MRHDIYAGRDPREIPAYSVANAAFLLNLPFGTLEKWVFGRPSRASLPRPSVAPLILRPPGATQLSFFNLLEAHTLSALRRHNIPLPNIRRALDTLRELYPSSAHPLLEHDFQTDGMSLFVEKLGVPIDVSRGGQGAFRELIEVYLRRVERDDRGLPVRLFPFVRGRELTAEQLADEPRSIEINAARSFGKPVLTGTGIPTATVASRFKAGEDVDDLAEDYGRTPLEINQAIRYELRLNAA